MALVTRTVTNAGAPLHSPEGDLLVGVKINFQLMDAGGRPSDAWDATTNERVGGETVVAITDTAGEFTVDLWPNTRGNRATKYKCRVQFEGFREFSGVVEDVPGELQWVDFMLGGSSMEPQDIGAIAAAMTSHINAADPHPQYAKEVDLGNAAGLNVGNTAGTVAAGDDPRLSDPRPPTGGAGGVLSGNYPNPGFAVDMATQEELDAAAAAKVDKVAGKGLSEADFTTAEKAKLALLAPVDVLTYGAGENQFDSSKVVDGVELLGAGELNYRDDGAVTGLIYIFGQSKIAISGLQSNSMNARFYVFLGQNKTTVIGAGNIGLATSTILAVPSGAHWFRLTVKQRNTALTDVSSLQIQYGDRITSYQPFVGRVLSINGTSVTQEPILEVGGQKNKFNAENVTPGYEVYGDGSLSPQADSAVSDYINVRRQTYITLSGLQSNTGFAYRYYVFFLEDKSTVAGEGTFAGNSVTLTVPTGAVWFRFSPKQRTSDPANYSTTQVEYGSVATTYEAFTQRVVKINGVEVEKTYAESSTFAGKKYLLFGDSITETGSTDDGNYGIGVRSNWPAFAKDILQMGLLRNYARSGASFAEYAGQLNFQKISQQISTAFSNAESPDVIVVACGSNDGVAYLSDYTTAMGKASLAALDMSTTTEAMRWAFWKIQTCWPTAIKFAVLPIQRADVETAEQQPLLDMLSKMAKRYSFALIDAHSESGIVKDFEVWSSSGRDLSDGLHPNTSGQIKMADLISAKIKNRLSN